MMKKVQIRKINRNLDAKYVLFHYLVNTLKVIIIVVIILLSVKVIKRKVGLQKVGNRAGRLAFANLNKKKLNKND